MSIPFLAAVLLLCAEAPGSSDLPLVDLGDAFDPAKVPARGARLERVSSPGGPALRVRTSHGEPWPGITLEAPGGRWDLERHGSVALSVRNLGPSRVTVHCRVDNPGADGVRNCITGSVDLGPGEAKDLRVALRRRLPAELAGALFGMRGYPEGWDPTAGLDPRDVVALVVFVARPTEDHAFEVSRVRAEGRRPSAAPPSDPKEFFPFIDTFGQYRHRDWPGKVRSMEELARTREEEAKDLAARPRPESWDAWGGWKDGPRLRATGRFRVEKVGAKWWLVDPDGRLFFSHGVDCVRMLDITPIDGRADWFEGFPGDLPDLREFLVPEAFALHGHYAGKRPRCYGFAAANLKRKYGDGWREATAELAHRRLGSWGLNTIGNWSEAQVWRLGRTAYVATLGSAREPLIEGSEGYWGKFPDVFDPAWQRNTRERLRRGAEATARDPWLIGYFVDNEMSWGDEASLGIGALRSSAAQAAKRALIADLEARYGKIAILNEAWGTAHASWDALAESRDAPDRERAREDLAAFYAKAADRYFAAVEEALEEAAPDALYLGCRFAWANPLAIRAAAKHCDVLSFNVYRRALELNLPEGVDRPAIIGEFHFGALDRGMFHTGLVPVRDQDERARAYREYVEACLAHPAIVGCHWFQYQDEPTTGRVYDEENYQIGFVDTADTPYPELVEAARAVGAAMYR